MKTVIVIICFTTFIATSVTIFVAVRNYLRSTRIDRKLDRKAREAERAELDKRRLFEQRKQTFKNLR